MQGVKHFRKWSESKLLAYFSIKFSLFLTHNGCSMLALCILGHVKNQLFFFTPFVKMQSPFELAYK